MPDYRFVVNLRSDTLAEPFRESIPTPAYLLAADHATPGMRDLASGVREQGLDPPPITATSELIGKTEAHFCDRARDSCRRSARRPIYRPVEELDEALAMADDADAPDLG